MYRKNEGIYRVLHNLEYLEISGNMLNISMAKYSSKTVTRDSGFVDVSGKCIFNDNGIRRFWVSKVFDKGYFGTLTTKPRTIVLNVTNS